MCIKPARRVPRREAGLSMIELIMFMVIVGMGVVAMVRFMSNTALNNVRPMLQKQGVAIAESLMEEILLQPFTTCEPEAYDIATNTCTQLEALGPETVGGVLQTRYDAVYPFNNVNDYNGFQMPAGIYSITNNTIVVPGLDQYTASVAITNPPSPVGGVATSAILRIDVTVTIPNGDNFTLTGYRFQYAPNAMP